MLIKNISFPTYLKDIMNIEKNNINVFVELKDVYTVLIVTAKNIEYLRDKEKMTCFEPSYPFIIVKKLTKEIITKAIESYASDDAYD